ncbi:MAG TPA: efflux RND transporter periplasmic adaptor subunit, partial [Rhizomicrobium sp.]
MRWQPLLAGAAALAFGCGTPASSVNSKAGPPPVSVEVVAVPREEITDVIDLVGQLEAEESVELKPETSGVVRTVGFEEGDEVAAGALLFELRDDEERAKRHEAEANLTLAEDELRRIRQLAAQKTVSPSELDRAVAGAGAAQARRDLAQVELDRMHILAPFDGVVGARQVSPGDRVSKTTHLVRVDAVKRLRLLFTLPEAVLNVAHAGNPVQISVAPYPGEQFPGNIYFVAPTLDPINRRMALKAWIPNAERRLKPGLFANIRLEVARREDALVVPESAVAYDADGVFVWRVTAAHSVERVPVELGIRERGRVEIARGLAVGDRIVAAGTHKVAPGVPVQEVAPVAPVGTSTPAAAAS